MQAKSIFDSTEDSPGKAVKIDLKALTFFACWSALKFGSLGLLFTFDSANIVKVDKYAFKSWLSPLSSFSSIAGLMLVNNLPFSSKLVSIFLISGSQLSGLPSEENLTDK